MTDDSLSVIPAPEKWRPVHRHATDSDSPSLTELDGAAKASFKASADALKVASETRALAVALGRLSALADAFEAEAGEQPPTMTGNATASALKMAARRLRDAIAKGVPG